MDTVTIIKIISSLLYPVGITVIFLLLGLLSRLFYFRRVAVMCYLLSVLTLLVFSNPQVASSLVSSLERQYPQQIIEDIAYHDIAIVLGGGLRIPLPPTKYSQLTSGSDRYWHAVRLFKTNKVNKILLSGGNVHTQAGFQGEAYYASQLMQKWGVPEAAILIEASSRTTGQNRDNTKDIIEKNGFKSALLVTSAIHMPRAYALFNKLPIPITPASADVIIVDSDKPRVFSWLPTASALSLSTAALHEYYGMWFTELKILISSF